MSKGDYDSPYDNITGSILTAVRKQPEAIEAVKPSTPCQTLGGLAEQYSKEHVSGGNWDAKTATTVQSVFADMFEIIGRETDITTISREQIVDFRDKVMKLPANRAKIPAYRGKSVAEILSMTDVTPMAHSSVRKRMTWVTSFFKWCSRSDYIPKNPAEGLVPAKSKRPASSERDPFNQAELQKLISALATHHKEKPDRPERLWVPLIALYGGMRLNEICQFHCADVKQIDDVWCFDVNQSSEDKKLKSDAGKRTVPIHPKLQDLGLLDYVAKVKATGEERLWPMLRHTRDGYAQAFSKWFAIFNDRYVVDDPKKVFHSLRHNFTNTLKQKGVQEVAIAEMVGHENPSITTSRYGMRSFSMGSKAGWQPRACLRRRSINTVKTWNSI